MTLFAANRKPTATPTAWSLRKQMALIAGLSALYFGITLPLAALKPLWCDEFFSLYLARLPTVNDLWAALSTGADQHPPFFYLLTRLSLSAFGENELAVRLPAILGFWLFSVALYFLVRPHTSPWFAAAAMVFPMSTTAYQYAYEARGYGPVLGFSAFALLCWTHVRTPRLRPWALVGLALSLAAAVGCHYYAVMLLVPLAAGEAVFTYRARKLDVLAWLGLAGASITLAASWHFITSARTFSSGFWAQPHWGDSFWFWQYVLGTAQIPLFAVLCGWLGVRAMAPPNSTSVELPRDAAPRRDHWPLIAALCCFIALPLLVMFGAKTITGAFHARYVIFAMIGPCVLLPWALHGLSLGRRLAGPTILVFMVSWGFGQGVSRIEVERLSRLTTGQDSEWLLEHNPESLPLVISRSDFWYVQSYYAPPEVQRHIAYLADPSSSRRLLGHDTVDRCALTLQPWFHLPIASYRDFLNRTDRFLLYTDIDTRWNWQLSELVTEDLNLNIIARHGKNILCEVTRRPKSNGHDGGAKRKQPVSEEFMKRGQ